jgi:hypothetical protein
MGPMLSRNVVKQLPKDQRNIPEERRPQLHSGESLKSRNYLENLNSTEFKLTFSKTNSKYVVGIATRTWSVAIQPKQFDSGHRQKLFLYTKTSRPATGPTQKLLLERYRGIFSRR